MRNRPYITLDTNIINKPFSEGKSPVSKEDVEKLLNLHEKNKCTLFLTTRIHSDVSFGPLKKKIAKLCEKNEINHVSSIVRLDYSRLDEDVFSTGEEVKLSEKIKDELFPNWNSEGRNEHKRVCDVDHLVAHFKAGHDFFITADQGISNKEDFLSSKGIQVKTLEEILEILQD